jgi:stearoyl-CoA desaturase (delta-9 desaturase)
MQEQKGGTEQTRFMKIGVLILVVAPLLAVVVATVYLWQRYVFASDILLLLVFYSITAFGITIGFHRMLTHAGFRTPDWLRALFLIAGCMAIEGSPCDWTATHIKHHAHSDEEGDPHSPLEGFWHAHMGWMFGMRPDVQTYAPHLLSDPLVMWVNRTWWAWATLGIALPYIIGGWTGFLWAGGVRVFLGTHITWSVNSICHTFGKRPFETTDESRNNWIVGLLAFGEGWHNNHHAFPTNAFHGMRWWQVDFSGLIIHFLEKIGLAWDVVRVSPEAMEEHAARSERTIAVANELRVKVLASVRELEQRIEKLAHPSVEHVRERLASIRGNVGRGAHMKRAALQRYLIELQALAEVMEPQPA